MLSVLWLSILFFSTGCVSDLAERTVKAPNLQQEKWRKHTLYPEVLDTMKDAYTLRVPVGPPAAELQVWVSNARPGDTVRYRIEIVGFSRRVRMSRSQGRGPTTLPATPLGTIVLLHGISDRQELDSYLLYKELLRTGNYRVVQVDLRGHGRSTGDWISYGVFEARDMVQVMDELEKQDLLSGEVGVLGFSYGGAVAIQWAAIDPRIKAVVAVEPYAEFGQVARDASWIFLGPFRWLMSDEWFEQNLARAGTMAGFDPKQASPLIAIQKTKTPVLLIHSRSDELTPFRHSEQLHAAAKDHTQLIALDKHSHFTIWATGLQPIMEETARWLKAHLSGPDTAPPRAAKPEDGGEDEPRAGRLRSQNREIETMKSIG